MEELSKHGRIGQAAMKADMDRKTARKYVAGGKLPSEMGAPRDWRTRPDPFEEHWPELEERLHATPELEAKTLFELLVEQHPGRYDDGQLRTLQRRVKQWRAAQGPEREVVIAQQHRAGEAAQTDFTSTAELAVTIAGQLFAHLLCVLVLPYSNWQWATVCLSESMAALRKGVQRALFQLGRRPRFHQTDCSTAATHKIPEGQKASFEDGKRPFNVEYVALMRHLGMTPRTTEVGAKAYLMRDELKHLWTYRTTGWADRGWADWYRRAVRSRIEPLATFAKRLAGYAHGIVAHARWPLHTSLLEGINNKIKVIKRMAYGLRDDEYFFLKIRSAFPGNSG